MQFGIVKRLTEEGKSEEEIKDYLKKNDVLKEVNKVVSVPLNLNPQIPKPNLFRRILDYIFNRKSKKVTKQKYTPIEKKVLIDLSDFKIRKEYTDAFKRELYNYTTKLFNDIIRLKFQNLFSCFENQNEEVANEETSNEFVRLFFIKVFRETVDFDLMGSKIVKSMDTLPERKKYFQYLNEKQNDLIHALDNYPELIDSYLEGNEDFTKNKLINDSKIIDEIIEFESRYKFLKAFNKKYAIEDTSDLVDEKYTSILSKFSKLFDRIDVIVFVYDKIESFNKLIPANINSLFFALLERGLITDNKSLFLKYVLEIHDIEVSKIRRDNSIGQTPFKIRMSNFLEEIDLNIPQKKEQN